MEAPREQARPGDGAPLPAALRPRLQRAWQQVGCLTSHMQTLAAERRALWRRRDDPVIAQGRQLFTRRGLGVNSVWLYGMAFCAWRAFQTPPPGGALAGLTPPPDQSGQARRALGSAQAGNRHMRAMAIAMAWAWRRFQPASALAQWEERRFGAGRARLRKRGIVALARQLLSALWRFVQTGGLPEGAVRKTAPRRSGQRWCVCADGPYGRVTRVLHPRAARLGSVLG